MNLIFAQASNAQYLLNFGWLGYFLLLIFLIIPSLLQIWVAWKINGQLEELKRSSKREEILFSKLHEIRVEHIAKLYDNLTELYWIGTEYFPRTSGVNSEKQKAFYKQLEIAWLSVEKTKICFPKEFGKKLSDFIQKMRSLAIDRTIANEIRHAPMSNEEKIKAMQEDIESLRVLNKDIPKMLESIEDDFRALMKAENPA
jgi:hypothetical protein